MPNQSRGTDSFGPDRPTLPEQPLHAAPLDHATHALAVVGWIDSLRVDHDDATAMQREVDQQLELARTAALVAIARSLDELAGTVAGLTSTGTLDGRE